MIDTRVELVNALYESAELEHGLLLQYLYAALSLKKRLDEGITGAQQELIRSWEGQILLVAREEMAHLGTVCNLLSAVGAPPRLSRPNFPQPEYYPFKFALAKLSDETLYRFIRFELPKGEPPPPPPLDTSRLEALAASPEMFAAAIPEPLEYEYIGELYRQIREAFNLIPEADLFIGPKSAQEEEVWSRRMQIMRVVNRETANLAIDDIIQDGEGAPTRRQGSHYNTFLKLRDELAAQPNISPARPVVLNPRTRRHRDSASSITLLENPTAVELTEIFNAYYEIALLMLLQLYSYEGETLGERNALRAASRTLMTMAIRPIAEILTEIPAMNDPALGTAGPSFELYSPLELSTQKQNRWIILNERYESAIADTLKMKDLHPRLAFIAENVRLIQNNINDARTAEERL